uniref:Potassium channel domain-containing protein n=1 Tax=Parascaris univalens TaxID=6257 RepID=A0A915A6Q8_PARUN
MDSEVLLRFQEAENVEDLRKLYSKLAVPQIRPKLCFLTYLVILPLYICFGGLVFWATDFRSSQKAQLRFDQFCFEEKYAIITLLKEHSDSVYNIFNYSRQKIDAIVNAIDKMEICHRKGVSDFRPKTFDPYNSIIFSYSVLTSTGYGDVHPFTVTGQILTIIYAVFGIPLNIAFTADFGELITKAISAITEYFRLLCNKGDQREGNKAQQLSQEVLFIIVSFVTTVYVNFLTIVVLFVERAQGWTFMDSMHFTFGSVSLIGFGDLVTRREKHYVFIVMPLLFIGETLMALVFGHLQAVAGQDGRYVQK